MRGAVPVLFAAHLLTLAVTRQVSALNPALRIPPNVSKLKKEPTAQNKECRKRHTLFFCQRSE